MFECDIILENRNDTMIKLIKEKISKVMKIMEEIKNADISEKQNIYHKYYG